jgi:hypothetical protein
LVERAANETAVTAVTAYRFPWPGYGDVIKSEDGFRHIAEPMLTTLCVAAFGGRPPGAAPGKHVEEHFSA